MSFVGLWICLVSGGLCATNAGRRHLNVSNAWSNGRRCFQLVDRQPATTRSSARRLNFTESSHRVQGANHATHHRPGPRPAAVGGAGRCRQRRTPRGHSRRTRSSLRIRSAHRLVVRLPRAPPGRGVGPTRVGCGQLTEVCAPATHCLRDRPGNLPRHAWTVRVWRSIPA